ncbi:MAG: hypothetical protein G01um10143_754 [Parcubacteria group bacterium Gr01-1014_3]|nr:MAG: hypothetical protein G01um10143_754 [Parcubacteria group bacterium Gr01-1014_3]
MEIKSTGFDKRFVGSTIALAVGILGIISLVNVVNGSYPGNTPIIGFIMTLGSLAYRSAKKRRLGLVQSTPLRRIGEILALLVIVWWVFGPIVLVSDGMYLWASRAVKDPLTFGIVPVWALTAYILIGGFRRK